MLFTDYYAEPSCTAGRANFITGQLPIRTGLTTVGQAGAKMGMPAAAPTIATALKSMGYATGQFGKNHLGDLNEYLPTVHGFDEFFGYLYHLDAMEDPAFHSYPPELKAKVGPRNMIHSWATDQRRSDRTAALGQGRQAEDRGRRDRCLRSGMKTVDDEILGHTFKFIDKAKEGRQAVLHLAEPDADARHHAPLREVCEEADAGERLVHLRSGHGPARRHRRLGHEEAGGHWASTDDTILVFTTDNGAENFTWPDGGQTPFAGGKGTVLEGGMRVPCIVRWPGKVPAGKVENQLMSGLDWFPTLVAAAGDPGDRRRAASTGKTLGQEATTRSTSTATTRPT